MAKETKETKVETPAEEPKVETVAQDPGVGTQVAIAENTGSDVTVVDPGSPVPDEFSEFEQDSGLGKQNISTADQAIPFISILQKLSPQVDKIRPEFIAGSTDGDFFNNVTQRVWVQENGLYVLPVVYVRRYTEWKPREDKGGGLVKDWGQDDSCLQGTTRDKRGRDVTAAGTIIQTAATFYSFLLDPEADWTYERCVFSFHSTQFRKGKNWNTTIGNRMIKNPKTGQSFSPAMFFSVYKLDSLPESNDQGSWWGWGIQRYADLVKLPTTPENTIIIPGGKFIYDEAKKFAQAIQDDLITVQMPMEEPEVGPGPNGPIHDGDAPAVPF